MIYDLVRKSISNPLNTHSFTFDIAVGNSIGVQVLQASQDLAAVSPNNLKFQVRRQRTKFEGGA